ncbi:cytochrome c biogenesis protein ResB [Nesterenkonia sp. MY13]|uniref:Cytochrome c biogenesis protein ResB n=1 Tax=Nesterenkonia sedimenti TaxID=1463632 RepID=A0A7X8TK13_9MICC|nr:cytochrome c biogenesis protein ResB [Nesterenkonia sedimenti]NLS10006.1 cytochrome c biogenesis protein ResB [Nesterenkonia sedimenti]
MSKNNDHDAPQVQPSAHRDNAREDAINTAQGTEQSTEQKGTSKKDVTAPTLGLTGMLRWAWTQLTSMRTALMLLLLLAIAAVPGSIFPQRVQDSFAVQTWIEDNPTAGPILDFFQFFDVYSSVWFSAIYLLLFISLIGCIIPRTRKHYQQMTSPPPRTPRRLARLPEYGALELDEDSPEREKVLEQAEGVLRRRRYRTERRPGENGTGSVGAEKGYLKEVGNILFHVSLVGVLVAVAVGSFFSYRGQKVLVEDEGFVNALADYDNFFPGTWFSEDLLDPFSIRLDSFDRAFDRQFFDGEPNPNYGQALDFTAEVTVRESPDAEPEQTELKVNDPLSLGGASIYLVGNGYAPVVTVRDGEGEVALSGPVITRPDDGSYTSMMVIKAPDAVPEQLGFVGLFLPSAHDTGDGMAISADPELLNPELHLNSYYGDLGLDDGLPQNVYVLDTEDLTELNSRESEDGGIVLAPGETLELPNGLGTIEFEGVRDYVALDITYNPATGWILAFSITATVGLTASLFMRRRRAWVKVEESESGRTLVTYGLLARGEDFRLRDENIALRTQFEKIWPVRPPEDENNVEKDTP